MPYVDVDVMKERIHCDHPERTPLYNTLLKFIDSLPEADVAPVVHAEFEFLPGHVRCGKCKKDFEPFGDENETLPKRAISYMFNYCPYCSAKMDGVKDDITFDNIIKEITQDGAEDS